MKLTSVKKTQESLRRLDSSAIDRYAVLTDDSSIRFRVEATTCTGLSRVVTIVPTPEGFRMGSDDSRFIDVCKASVVASDLKGSPVSSELIRQLLITMPPVVVLRQPDSSKGQGSKTLDSKSVTAQETSAPVLVFNPFGLIQVPSISPNHPIRSNEHWSLLSQRYPSGVVQLEDVPGSKYVTLDDSKRAVLLADGFVAFAIPCTSLANCRRSIEFIDATDAKLIAFKAMLLENAPVATDALRYLFYKAKTGQATEFDVAAFTLVKLVSYNLPADHPSDWYSYFQSLFRGSATRIAESLLSKGLPARYELKKTATGELSGGYDLAEVSTL